MDTRDITDLTPATLAALAKLTTNAAKATRDDLEPGTYELDTVVTIALDGTVKVSADTDKVPTCSIPLLPALALMVKRMGIQREKALTVLREVMVEALEMSKDAREELLKQTGAAEAEKQLKEQVLAKLPRQPVKGTVRVKGNVGIPG